MTDWDEPFTCPHCGNDRFELYFGGTRPARVICTNCDADVDAFPADVKPQP